MTYVLVTLALVYFGYVFIFGGLTREEKKRVFVIAILFFFAAIFWAGFEQAPTSLNLFAKDFTQRTVLGWRYRPSGSRSSTRSSLFCLHQRLLHFGSSLISAVRILRVHGSFHSACCSLVLVLP